MNKAVAVLISLLMLASAIPLGLCAKTIEIPYNAFNSLALTSYALDKSYEAWEAKVYYELTADTSHSKYALVRFCSSDTSPYVELSFLGDGVLAVYISRDGSENVWIAEGNYAKGETVKVTLTSEGKLSVYSKGVYVVKDYSFQQLTIAQVSGHGDASATGGSVKVYVSEGMQPVIRIVYSFIPVVVAFAMLAVALGFIKKFA